MYTVFSKLRRNTKEYVLLCDCTPSRVWLLGVNLFCLTETCKVEATLVCKETFKIRIHGENFNASSKIKKLVENYSVSAERVIPRVYITRKRSLESWSIVCKNFSTHTVVPHFNPQIEIFSSPNFVYSSFKKCLRFSVFCLGRRFGHDDHCCFV